MRKNEIAVAVLILLVFLIAIYFYPRMPERMASHWNAQGEVDGYMSKFWGLFLVPFISAGLALLFIAIPRIDPLKANIQEFRRFYDGFVIIFLLFILAVYFQSLLWNLGTKISFTMTLPIGLGVLFFYVGVLCDHAKRNWFIGIRTPWTLSSETVWERTHKLGGKLFKLAGLLSFMGMFFRKYAFLFVVIPVLGLSVYTVVYSYFAYQREIR